MTILLQRLCWNTNSWRGPTGDMYGKEDSYVGQNGFGHEEWNLNTSDLLDRKAFGYIYYNPPGNSSLIGKTHDVFFYAINPTKARALVGYYEGATFLDQEGREKLKNAFERSDILVKRVEELLALGLPSIKTTKEARHLLLNQFAANIVVNPKNVHFFGTPVVLSAEMLEGREPKYLSRYTKPVFLKTKPTIRKRKSGASSPSSTGSDQKLIEDAYLRFTKAQQKVVFRLHNQLSNRFRKWLRGIGVQDISAESAFVDIQCTFQGKLHLFELKTCYQQATKHAIRDALGQILEYSYFPGRKQPSFSAVVLDTEPTDDEITWCKAMVADSIQIELFWLKGEEVYSASITTHPLAVSASHHT
ncbi:MAG: hypothetical protein WC426_09345 [Sulfuriferula sp.]